ncbi:thioredoxin family protein [bacterium]|jgi:hypothetical protein|nr:thioredoxin family protein [bacterium]
MLRSFAALVLSACPVMALAGEWLTDYAQAYQQSKTQDKPIFVYFTDSATDASWKSRFEGLETVADKFVTVVADKAEPTSAEMFKSFEIDGKTGAVVVERNREWQYFRTSRDLDKASLTKVLEDCQQAKGRPANSVLTSISNQTAETAASTPTTMALPASSSSSYCPRCQRFR